MVIARGQYEPKRKLASCDITLVRRNRGRWHRSDVRMRQKYHRQQDVVAALRRAGFAVEVYDAAADLGMRGEFGQSRTFFLAKKARA